MPGLISKSRRFRFLQPYLFFLIVLPLCLAGCNAFPLEKEVPGATLTPYFVAPSKAQPSPVPKIEIVPSDTPGAVCDHGLTFIADLSLPDGITAGTSVQLKKLWKVQNSGTCNWDVSYSFRLISGAEMSAGNTQRLYPARSGTEAILEIDLVTPDEPGRYTATWQAFDPQDNPFGDPLIIDIIVVSE